MTKRMNEPNAGCPESAEKAFAFLQTQVNYVTWHLQIADSKAAAIITYISVLSGYTASKVSLSAEPLYQIAGWLAMIGWVVGFVAQMGAFLAVLPRDWPGRDPRDTFSWVGLSASASLQPYSDRILQMTVEEMQKAIADTVETCSLVILRKYRYVSIAVVCSLIASVLQTASLVLI